MSIPQYYMLRMLEICSFLDPDLSSKMQVTFLVHLLVHFLYCCEPLINCCPVCGEILEVSNKLNTLVHLSLCFDERTRNQVMTGGFLTDKQASYGWMFKLSEWAHFSSYDVGLNSGSSASHILVMTAPMSSINAIAVEAFKKYILVCLIQNSQDNNLGLVKQVISSMYKRNIQRLTQTYLTLSLQDIAKIVQLSSPKEAEMIMTLSKKLNAVDELLSCDPLYLAKAGRERQRFDFDDFDPVSQKFNI
ncbi:COP9 signalosome complex subunit 3-like [Populus alba]|uniref:COP9 signalosome complex subunit 3-like n=1 Tax=Populus alba TaxID=43335 RepID=UPI003CC6F911